MNKNHSKKNGQFIPGDGDGDGETGEHLKKILAQQKAGVERGEIQHNWFKERQDAVEKDRADRAALYDSKVEAQSPESQLSDHIAAHREATGSSYATARAAAQRHMGRRDLPTGRTPRLNQPTVEVQDEKGVRHTIRMAGSYRDRTDAIQSLKIGYPKMTVVRFHGD